MHSVFTSESMSVPLQYLVKTSKLNQVKLNVKYRQVKYLGQIGPGMQSL